MVRRRPLLVLCLAIGTEFVAFSSFTLIAPLYGVQLGAGTAAIGALVSLGFVLPMPLALPIGAALRYVGVRVPLVTGPLLLALGALAPALWEGLASLAVAEVLVGLGHLGVVLASQTAVGALGTRAEGEANFGTYAAAVAVGQMVGPFVAGAFGDVFGLRASLLVAACAAVAASAVMALAAPGIAAASGLRARRPRSAAGAERASAPTLASAPARAPAPASTRAGGVRSVLALARVPGLRYAVLVSAAVVMARMTHSTFLPVYLAHHAFRSTDIGLLTSFLALVTVLVRPLLPLATRWSGGRANAIPAAVVLAAAGMAMVALPPTWPTLVVMTVLLGVGLGVGQPLSMVVSSDAVPEDLRGAAFGYRLMTNRFTQVVGPALLGVIAGVLGLASAFLLTAAALAALLPTMVRFRGVVSAAEAEPASGSTHG